MTTNYDYYRDEILKLDDNNYKVTSKGEIEQCNVKYGDGCNCTECIFNDRFFKCCDFDTKIRWLFKEYKPMLTQDEYNFLKCLKYPKHTYIVRFDTGALALCIWEEPFKSSNNRWCISDNRDWLDIDDEMFSFITKDDGEAWKVSDLLNLKREEL